VNSLKIKRVNPTSLDPVGPVSSLIHHLKKPPYIVVGGELRKIHQSTKKRGVRGKNKQTQYKNGRSSAGTSRKDS